ncbi:MAG: fibrillarin-like rRNA/tRNA 2'-O-methyltransferase [Candidatus ainarchaeum sp.]|nr:fibrillarin-like rRNA/tRNA 2'-O-methyltransferase [Candidatus ainarchaeum sp.]
MKELFEGVYSDGKNIFTKNLLPGKKVYGEKLIQKNGIEYRTWNPFKSKYCAGIKNDLKKNIFFKKSIVLYLGSAEGTSVSHVSDIIGEKGIIFCVDLSNIAMQKLAKLAEERKNLFPILSDANKIENYLEFIEKNSIDILFQDISQRNQIEIFLKNSIFLKKNCFGALSLKTKSISQENAKKTLEIEKKKLEEKFEIIQIINLEPFEKEHYLIIVKKK